MSPAPTSSSMAFSSAGSTPSPSPSRLHPLLLLLEGRIAHNCWPALLWQSCRNLAASPENLTSPALWIPFLTSVTFRLHEAKNFYQIFTSPTSPASPMPPASTSSLPVHSLSESCTQLEPDFPQLHPKLYNKPVLPVGLLQLKTCMGIGGGGAATGKRSSGMGSRRGRQYTFDESL